MGFLKIILITNMQLFTSQNVNWCTGVVWICGLLWCFYQLFRLSFWQHPFTAEDPLVSKWWNATFLQIWSDEKTNSSTSWMAWGWMSVLGKLFFKVVVTFIVVWWISWAKSSPFSSNPHIQNFMWEENISQYRFYNRFKLVTWFCHGCLVWKWHLVLHTSLHY